MVILLWLYWWMIIRVTSICVEGKISPGLRNHFSVIWVRDLTLSPALETKRPIRWGTRNFNGSKAKKTAPWWSWSMVSSVTINESGNKNAGRCYLSHRVTTPNLRQDLWSLEFKLIHEKIRIQYSVSFKKKCFWHFSNSPFKFLFCFLHVLGKAVFENPVCLSSVKGNKL